MQVWTLNKAWIRSWQTQWYYFSGPKEKCVWFWNRTYRNFISKYLKSIQFLYLKSKFVSGPLLALKYCCSRLNESPKRILVWQTTVNLANIGMVAAVHYHRSNGPAITFYSATKLCFMTIHNLSLRFTISNCHVNLVTFCFNCFYHSIEIS